MLLLIISEYYCPTTFLPLADTPPECSCPICLCSKGWLNTREAVSECICSSPSNQRFSLLFLLESQQSTPHPRARHLLRAFWCRCCARVRTTAHSSSSETCQMLLSFQPRRRNCGKDTEISPFLVSESFEKIYFLH